MKKFSRLSVLAAASLAASSGASLAQDAGGGWFHGDWYLTVGATGMVAPDFEGGKKYMFRASPIVSLGKVGPEARFTSRNDNISFSVIDDGQVRAGLTGKFLYGRDEDDADALKGLDPIRWGGEVGAFIEFYPTEWLRVRAEARHGIRSHNGLVGDLALDAFYDVSPTVRISAGPRLSMASESYFDSYYGVNPYESAVSGISPYDPDGGGIKSYGFGGAINWKLTEQATASLFGEYARLEGKAADSTLVKERGSENQFMVGVSATYRFDFTM